jgi:hypothetical protein
MPTLLGDLALGTAVVDDYSLKNREGYTTAAVVQMSIIRLTLNGVRRTANVKSNKVVDGEDTHTK